MRKLLFTSLVAGALTSTFAFGAKVTFSLDIESLATGAGSPLTNSGLLVLIVDSEDDGFQSPVADTIVTGDDQIVATWDLSEVGQGSSGITLVESEIEYQAGWDAGDPLALVWFPGLSDADQTPATDEPYGFFSDKNNLVSGHSWRMPPSDAFLHSLKLLTESASELLPTTMGDVPDSVGRAAYAVGQSVNPTSAPSSLALAASGTSIQVSWTGGSAGNGGYLVQRRKTGTTSWKTVGITDGSESSYTDSMDIEPGASYDYRLVSFSGYDIAESLPELIQAIRSKIINLAARGFMGDDVVTRRGIGLAVTGSEEMNVLIQAVGPSLPGPFEKPLDTLLTFFYGIAPQGVDRQIAENDEWDLDTDEATAILAAQDSYGAQVLGVEAGDSAIIAPVRQIVGGYTTRVQNPVGGGGISSVQVYDINYLEDDPADARLTGLASRGFVGTGIETLRGSFNIYGQVPMKVIIRANGPMLRDLSEEDPFNAETTLADPFMTVLKWNVVEQAWEDYATNDNWGTRTDGLSAGEINDIASSVGLLPFPEGSSDCVVVDDFEPGIYTAIVNGVGDTTGVALIEIYEVPTN